MLDGFYEIFIVTISLGEVLFLHRGVPPLVFFSLLPFRLFDVFRFRAKVSLLFAYGS